MRTTQTKIGTKAKEAILQGVNAVFIPVSKTFGPQGKNALLYRTFNRGSRITNDGYTVAEVQEPKDPFIRQAATTFKEACKRTNERVGDGTTCTAILAGTLYNELYKIITENHSIFGGKSNIGVMTLKNDIENIADSIKEQIKASAKKIETLEELEKIAIVSVEDIGLGKTIAKMAWEVGITGFIDTVEGYKGEIETEIIKGMRFPAKVPGKAFVNNPTRYEMVAKDSPVLITNFALDNLKELEKPFQEIMKENPKLIVIAPFFSTDVLVDMVKANSNGYNFVPVHVPSLRTEQFEDLAIYCGAKFINKEKGMEIRNVKVENLGFLGQLIVKDTESREDAVATGGKGTHLGDTESIKIEGKDIPVENISPVEDRIRILQGQLLETQQEQFKKLLERRIASMASAVGIIRVGDSTQASSLYRKLKIEDAVYACKAALRGGYVKGGGLCLKEIADALNDDNLLKKTLLAPYETIQASVDGGIEITKDIIDPAEAIYYALEHAVSVVANLITVEIMTIEEEERPMVDGYLAIARALNEFTLAWRRKEGLLKDNEMERERELTSIDGIPIDDYIKLDKG